MGLIDHNGTLSQHILFADIKSTLYPINSKLYGYKIPRDASLELEKGKGEKRMKELAIFSSFFHLMYSWLLKVLSPAPGYSIVIESFSYEWEVRYGSYHTVTVLHHNCAVSKHSDWLSDDFAHCVWLNTMSSIPYSDHA